ncbi:MAG: TrkA family potassium uptake protein [Chloroflexi bacterium]|nr:TrkA family potassium uptake protein [Chloroflexota bacterium]
MNVVIMGCGRTGEQLTLLMLDQGHHVAVIDQDAAALARLPSHPRCQIVRGVGFDRDVLLKAGIEEAETFAATSRSDNANIVAARIAHNVFRVPRVVCRLQDPHKVEIYQRLGLISISPAHWGAQRINELLTHADLAPVMTFGNGEVTLMAVEMPVTFAGRLVRDFTVPGEVNVVAITRGKMAFVPTTGTELREGDILHLAVLATAMERVEMLLGGH